VIELKHLQKLVGQGLAIDVEALTVGVGEIAALVGPQGSDRAKPRRVFRLRLKTRRSSGGAERRWNCGWQEGKHSKSCLICQRFSI